MHQTPLIETAHEKFIREVGEIFLDMCPQGLNLKAEEEAAIARGATLVYGSEQFGDEDAEFLTR
jgi:hypothetical protein